MIRKIALSALFLMAGVSAVMAQEATIIELKGQVFARQDSQSDWQEAQVSKVVSSDGEIKTVGNSSCTLAFDEKRKNIVTVKDHTQIRVESVLPGKVFLSEGRVFALIKNVSANKKFEVRTSTAVAGARGTGWLTEVISGETNISCFDDVVFVESLDLSGAVTSEINLNEGFQVNVEEKGVETVDVKEVNQADMKEWQGFVESVQHFVGPEIRGHQPGQEGQMPQPPHTGGQPTGEAGFHMNQDQMMLEAQRVLGDNPEKMADFERMLQEGQERFGADFERLLMNGGSGNEAFEAFVREMIQKFGDDFEHAPSTEGSDTTGGPYVDRGQMPPPPPDGYTREGEYTHYDENYWGDSGAWDTTYYYDSTSGSYAGFYDYQNEVNQTLIDNNLAACGHYCCPFPQCCGQFSDPMANSFCLAH